MRVLHFDCFAGISGDMTVGALCDLGVAPSAFEWELSKLAVEDHHLHFGREMRQHIEGVKFGVHGGHTHHDHCEDHDHGHGHGRSHREIRLLLEKSELSDFVKTHSIGIFARIAEAEGKIHGQPAEDVTFHEVGALDSIVDIVCACVGLEQLGVEKIYVGALSDGQGWTESAHGRFPVPVPATVELLRGFSLQLGDGDQELITPTGAAILAEFALPGEPVPPLHIEKIGYGLGTRQLPDRPNVLRAVLAEVASSSSVDQVALLETNLDDLSPEIAGATASFLLEKGALDVWLTPVQMKKGRPGFVLSVLCEPARASDFVDQIFRQTSAFGLRRQLIDRVVLERRLEQVATPFGEITVKIGSHNGETLQIVPEFESCLAAARAAKVPVREVMSAAAILIARPSTRETGHSSNRTPPSPSAE